MVQAKRRSHVFSHPRVWWGMYTYVCTCLGRGRRKMFNVMPYHFPPNTQSLSKPGTCCFQLRLPGQRAPEHPALIWVLGIRTLVFLLVRQRFPPTEPVPYRSLCSERSRCLVPSPWKLQTTGTLRHSSGDRLSLEASVISRGRLFF